MIGHNVIRHGGINWRWVHGALFAVSPPHEQVDVSTESMRRLIRATGARFARWEEGFERPQPTEWWHVIKDSSPDLDTLSKKVRYQVRQGLKTYAVSRCAREAIIDQGYEVYVRAYSRYSTFETCFTKSEFVAAIHEMPGNVEFWSVRDRMTGEMVAFAENFVDSASCFYSSMWFCPVSLKSGAAYALVYGMNVHYLSERGFRYVSDGARNLSHQTNIHHFLQSKFGFRRAYCKLRVVYSARVGFLVRVLYPFRRLIGSVGVIRRLSVLLEQERIRRICALP